MVDGINVSSWLPWGNKPAPAAPPLPPPEAPAVLPAEVPATPQGFQAPPVREPDPQGKSAGEAVSKAMDIWTQDQKAVKQDEVGNIESKPIGADLHDGPLDVKATLEVEANQKLVDNRLAGLKPDQQKAFRNLEKQFEHGTPPDPQAHLALQVLLLTGQLTDDRKLSKGIPGQDLLTTLNGMTTQPLAPGIDRGQLMGGLVREIARPASINQQNRNSCTVATAQIMLARDQPAEYARIVGGLATPDGKVVLASGSKEDTVTRYANLDPKDPRTTSSKLFQTSMMQFAAEKAYGPGAKYIDGPNDHIEGADGQPILDHGKVQKGITQVAFTQVLHALTSETYVGLETSTVRNAMCGDALTRFKNGEKPTVTLASAKFNTDGSHDEESSTYTITGHKESQPPGNGTVTLVDDKTNKPVIISENELYRRIEKSPGLSHQQAQDKMDAMIDEQIKLHSGASVALKYGEFDKNGEVTGNHEVLVTHVDKQAGMVYYTNPHGDEESMSLTEFHNRIHSVQGRPTAVAH